MKAYNNKSFLLLCCVCMYAVSSTHAVVANEGDRESPETAIKAKDQYEASGDDEAIRRLESAVGDQSEMGKILSWIRDDAICLRRGTEAVRACYALSDFGLPSDVSSEERGRQAFWFIRPYTQLESYTKKWYEHLYNTVAKILLLEKDPTAPLLLATRGGDAGGEKYNVFVIGIGDKKTFGKSRTTGEKVGESKELNVTEDLDDLKGAVNKVLAWIKKTCQDSQSD